MCHKNSGQTDLYQMEQAVKKKIAVLNAKQFVSEISFNGQMITIEELDVSDESTTFPYIKAGSGKDYLFRNIILIVSQKKSLYMML